MSSSADIRSEAYDGLSAEALRSRLSLPRVEVFQQVSSTLDVAHTIAPDAPAGTLIVADEQIAGRGRQGRKWTSRPTDGVWLTLIERPRDASTLDVLALRCGLAGAEALEPLATHDVAVKWPNDLYVDGGKLAGILIEIRWRGGSPEWVAIGFGVNVVAPDVPLARGLRAGVSRLEVLERLVPALRDAASSVGHLTQTECDAWRARDFMAGQRVTSPGEGTVSGITAAGEIRIREADNVIRAYRSGSLILASSAPCS